MLSVSILLLVAALIACVASAMGKCQLWISVVLVIVWGLLQVLPR